MDVPAGDWPLGGIPAFLFGESLQLEVDVAIRLRLAAIAHIYPILPYCQL